MEAEPVDQVVGKGVQEQTKRIGEEAKIGAGGGVLGFGNNAAQSRPSAGAMAEAGEGALGQMGTTIAASQATLQSSGTTTKHDIGGNADGVVNTEELAELIKKR